MNISLDVHAHLVPVNDDSLGDIDGVQWDGSKMTIDGHKLGMAKLFQPQALVDWMAAQGVARALVSAPPPTYRQQLDAEACTQWWHYINAGLVDIANQHDTLVALPHLPLEHPKVALVMAQHYLPLSQDNGFNAVAIAAGSLDDVLMSNGELDDLWQYLDQQQAFVFIHPAHCCDGRLKSFYLENLVGNPHETAIACAHMVFAELPSRYPNIRFCLAHGGGSVPMLAGRWQRGLNTDRPGVNKDMEAPQVALQRLYADCITHDADALTLAQKTFGTEHILFGSDWPFPMGVIDTQGQLADVDPHTLKQITQDNGNKLLSVKN